jgi:amino acid adenylation domain-containing protein
MSDFSRLLTDLPREQQAIRAKCFHPSGSFVEFGRDEIEQSVPAQFERIAARHADRIAVKTRSHTLTYDALNKVANRVARVLLRQLGESNKSVALLLDNDAPMIASLLGVLKAGKAYVSLDPSHPLARSSYILEDSQAILIVTDSNNMTVAEGLARPGQSLFNVDEIDCSLSAENLGLGITPDTLSVVRYTSGSTGQPKGVAQDHRGLLHHYVMHNINGLRICPDDRIATGSIIQDAFNALLAGAAFYPLDLKKDGLAALPDWMAHNNITIYFSVPSIFRRFMDTLSEHAKFSNLRLIALRGETVSKADIELYKKHFSDSCILVNRLGSRETGTFRQYFISKETQIAGDLVPAGYPVIDKEVLLLNNDGTEVGYNQIGEIAVKSHYLRLGYWRRPELTKAKFLPDPRGGDEGIYLTGDLGRLLPDGCLEYLGRKDFQIKIRGYRVEVVEIEMALRECANVKDAAVIAWDNQAGEKYLAAYVVPREEPGPKINELREFLRGKLPDYMIPAEFVYLKSLPSINGKLDRKALPRPDHKRPDLSYPYVPQRNEVEQKLILIWEEVLGVSPIGVHDKFFDLGGHSLSATRTVSRVLDTFRVEVSLTSLFESPTIADMAAVVTQSQAKKLVGEEDLARVLAEVEELPDEDVERLIAEERHRK